MFPSGPEKVEGRRVRTVPSQNHFADQKQNVGPPCLWIQLVSLDTFLFSMSLSNFIKRHTLVSKHKAEIHTSRQCQGWCQSCCSWVAGWLAARRDEGRAVGFSDVCVCVLLDPAPCHTCISEPLANPRAWASSGVKPFFSVLLTVCPEKG